MGYKIQYGRGGAVRFRKTAPRKVPRWCVILLCICITLAAFSLGWQNRQIRDFLLPGDPEVTAHALQSLAEDIRSGESFMECVSAFCAEVMENAKVSP